MAVSPQDTLLDFADRTVVVTGVAAGMGAALTQRLAAHGAVVHGVDVVPVDTAGRDDRGRHHVCDLAKPSAIEGLVAALPADIDALFNCAGVPNGGRFSTEEVMAVNWLGLRELTELVLPRMPAGSAVVHVASTAGRAWQDNLAALRELMAAETFAEGLAWVAANPGVCGDGYAFSKQAVQYYTMWRALETIGNGVRMNAINPGITNTQLIADFRRGVGDATLDRAEEVAGRLAEAHEMAPAMLFLADEASSSYINGVNLNVDRGTGAAHLTGAW